MLDIKTILQSTGALISSGLILFVILLLFITPIMPERTLQITNGNSLSQVQHLTNSPSVWTFYPIITNGEAVWARLTSFDASHYPIVLTEIIGRSAATKVAILWRTSNRPNVINQYSLPWAATSMLAFNLNSVRQWHERILNIGIAVGGYAPGPVTVKTLQFQSPSVLGYLQLIWTVATSFEGFHAYTINFLHGGLQVNNAISGNLIVAIWIGVAVLLNLFWQFLFNNQWQISPLVTIFLIGWLLLDMRWQLELIRQYAITVHEYAGQSVLVKRLNGADGPLLRFLTSVKDILPLTPQRILLIPSDQDIYHSVLQKASFYLRPHNVYAENFDPLCQAKLQPGDYVLALGKSKLLRYTARNLYLDGCNVLTMDKVAGLMVERIVDTASGQLFLISP